jgi:hypothetical protein
VTHIEFRIGADAYVLVSDRQAIARLEGGPGALLAGAPERLRNLDIEVAIERAEDWLMPSSKSWQGLPMRVRDEAGRLRRHFGALAAPTPVEVEQVFSRAVDDVAFGRAIDAALFADILMLRELVHHGAISRITLE